MKKSSKLMIEKKLRATELKLAYKGKVDIYYIKAIGFYDDQEGNTVIAKLELTYNPIVSEKIKETVITTDEEGAILISFEGRQYISRVYMIGEEYHTESDDWVKVIELGAEEIN